MRILRWVLAASMMVAAVPVAARAPTNAHRQPTQAQKVDAVATALTTWNALPAASAELAVPIAVLMHEAAGVPFGEAATEQQPALLALLTELRARGIETRVVLNTASVAFEMFRCRSKQGEARTLLRGLALHEANHLGEHGAYSTSLAALEFEQQPLHYTLSITSASPTAFRAVAQGTGDMAGDTWTVGEDAVVAENTANLCATLKPAAVPDALPPLPAPSAEAVAAALATFSAMVNTEAVSDLDAAARNSHLVTVAVFALAMQAIGLERAPTADTVDAARLKALVARVKAHGGDLVAVVAPELDKLAVERCEHFHFLVKSYLGPLWNAAAHGASRELLSPPTPLPVKVAWRGAGEHLVITATGTDVIAGHVWKVTANGLTRPKQVCSAARWPLHSR